MRSTDLHSGLTQDDLRKDLHYDPQTGVFTWLSDNPRKGNSRKGLTAGTTHKTGYKMIWVSGRHYLAHRLAWLYVHGEWPKDLIDHIDGNRSNNCLSNLRPATNSQNKSNGKCYRHNTSGYKGVSKFRNKWRAQVMHNYKMVYLGLFLTKEEAHEAYLQAAQRLQGEFARAA